MPVVFVGHGAPLLAVDAAKGEPLRTWGAALPRPRAVLVLSAHWEASPPTVGATQKRPLVYDFSGFPKALYEVQYPAPGAPELAARVAGLLPEIAQRPERGLDHGVWTPLVWMFPRPDVPVLQLSLPGSDPQTLAELGVRLAPLRDEGVLIVGSGNVTHNLSRMRPEGTAPESWAVEFDAWVKRTLDAGDLDALLDYPRKAPAARVAHPTVEHFSPLVAVAAAGAGGVVRYPVTGWEFGSLSRRAVQLG